MGLRIGTNVASIAAQRHLAKSEKQATHAMQAMSSGSRIVNASDDAAGFAISEGLRGQGQSLMVAKQNALNAVGLVQVAEGGLSDQNNILVRLRELSIQSASDTVGDEERAFIDIEVQELVKELDRVAKTTRFGNKYLLTGTNEKFEFHLGTGGKPDDVITYRMDADTRAGSLGVDSMDVLSKDGARDALDNIDQAIQKVASARAGFGAMQSRLEIAANHIDVQRENILAARSRIADADFAYEVSQMVQGQVLQEIGMSVLAQANQSPNRALRLL